MAGALYARIHRTLVQGRGSAVGVPCSHPTCDRLATGWALVGHPTHIGTDSHGKPVRMSTDLERYAPACTSHNAQQDHGGDWLYCPHGHFRAVWGADRRGFCIGCRRDYDRRRNASRKTSRRLARTTAHTGIITEQNGGQS